MNEKLQYAVKSTVDHAQAELRNASWAMETLGDVLADLDDIVEYVDISTFGVSIVIPWGAKYIARVRQTLGDGWELRYASPSGRTYHSREYVPVHNRQPGQALNVTLSSSSAGSTCKRVQVGTETIERPVYEVVCDDEPETAEVLELDGQVAA